MKYQCPKCKAQYICPEERNPPPSVLEKTQQFIQGPNLTVNLKLKCQCSEILGQVVFSSQEVDQIGWWFLYPKLLIEKHNEKEWVNLIRVASSGYVIRISNILAKLERVESTAYEIASIIQDIKKSSTSEQ